MSVRTPLILSRHLTQKFAKRSNLSNVSIYLKLENVQPSGSFKLRGIENLCKKSQNCNVFLSSSGGNAGLATAWVANQMNKEAVIVVPEGTDPTIVEDLELFQAKVLVHGSEWKDAHQKVLEMEKKVDNALVVHPFDHPLIWEGYESIVSEIKEDLVLDQNEKALFVLCCGGGGLLTGVGQGILKNGLENSVNVLVMETIGAETFNEGLKAGHPVVFDKITSRARTLAGNPVCEESIRIGKKLNVFSEVVSDDLALVATKEFLQDHKMLVELSCGSVLASVYDGASLEKAITSAYSTQENVKVVLIICGGRGTSSFPRNW